MTCAICHRTIPKKDVEAKRYVFSRFTGNHYCLREHKRKKKSW